MAALDRFHWYSIALSSSDQIELNGGWGEPLSISMGIP